MNEDETTDSDLCTCGHANDPHVLAATIWFKSSDGTKDLPAGGHRYCPVVGCQCHSTWSLPDEVVGFDVRRRLAEDGEPDRALVRHVRGH